MSKKYVIILFAVLIGGAITAGIIYVKQFTPKYDWNIKYTKNSEQPYGLKLFYNVLKGQSKGRSITSNQYYGSLDTTSSNGNLVFVGHEMDISRYDRDCILNYVARGNTALISCRNAPFELSNFFISDTGMVDGYDYSYDSVVNVDFTKAPVPYPKAMNFHYQHYKKQDVTFWAGYDIDYFTDSLAPYGFAPIAYINDSLINCYSINYGLGKIIFHTNPILFSNYHMVGQNGFEHANNMLSYLNDGPIYWNEEGPLTDFGEKNVQDNPLAFLFSHFTLRWGWYLFLITIILFLVFRSKREQRIIPVLSRNVNTSVEFTKAIGTLYFQKGGHNNIAAEMYLLFLSDIRTRYYIATDKEDDNLIDQLSVKAGIDKIQLTDLFTQFDNVQFGKKATAKELINLYQSIDKYNKTRK